MKIDSVLPVICFYAIASVAVFLLMLCFWSGFPGFPAEVASANSMTLTTSLKGGSYDILFFRDGRGTISVSPSALPQVSILETTKEGRFALNFLPRSYYFNTFRNGAWVEGHAAGHLDLDHDSTITIHTANENAPYRGIIVRTGLMRFLEKIAIYEALVIALTFGCFVFVSRSRRIA